MATAHWGQYALKDLIANNATIQAYGEDRIIGDLGGSLNVHNDAINTMLGPLVAFTDQRMEPYGSSFSGTRIRGYRADQQGAVDTSKTRTATAATSILAYPLDRWQYAWQFTRDYAETATVKDAALRALGIQQGDLDRVEFELRNALFNPVNDLLYHDYLIDQFPMAIRRLANADGQLLPIGPNGVVFNGSSHNHYVGRAGGSLAAADISALFDNVIEHGVLGQIRLYIPLSMEPTIRAMANFYPYMPEETETIPQPGDTVMRDQGPLIPTVNPPTPDNMAIGRWNAKYEVWTKPWIYDNYCMVVDTGKKPLKWRSRAGQYISAVQNSTGLINGVSASGTPSAAFGAQGRAALRIVGTSESFPLRGEWMEREFGMAVGDRLACAILYAGGTSYVMPTITLPAL